MDFEEWFESRDDIGCLIALEGYAAEEAWNARQAEIDELQKRIDGALKELEDIYFYKTQNSNTAIKILKGE